MVISLLSKQIAKIPQQNILSRYITLFQSFYFFPNLFKTSWRKYKIILQAETFLNNIFFLKALDEMYLDF